jgi:hypothetical protein
MEHPLRYSFEHKMLPDGFFHHTEAFLSRFTINDNELFELFDIVCKDTKMDNLYKKEDFKIERYRMADDVFVIKLIMPEPECSPGCYFIYCFFDLEFKKLGFYTIEKDEDADEMRLMMEDMRNVLGEEEYNAMFGEVDNEEDNREMLWICGWNKDGIHLNYGKCYYELDDLLGRCFEIYQNNSEPNCYTPLGQ